MGIKIFRPEIYLGNKTLSTLNFSKKHKNYIKEKIGSTKIHVETKKNILEMATEAARKAIYVNKIIPSFLILVSQGQDNVLPSCAEQLATNLNLDKNILVITISSGCSGFVQSIIISNKLLEKKNQYGMIVCAEKYSKYIKNNNFKTRLLFSDAASATIIKYIKKKNILSLNYGFDGKNASSLEICKKRNILNMNGTNIFLFGINNIPNSIKKISSKFKIDKYLIHNGSKIMVDEIIKKSQIQKSKAFTSYHVTGNTVSSSIPLLLNINYKKFKKNQNILLSGFGVGLSWATLLLKWN